MHGSSILLVVLVYFIIVVTVLTLLWRITLALDRIGQHLAEMSKDLKTLADKKEK